MQYQRDGESRSSPFSVLNVATRARGLLKTSNRACSLNNFQRRYERSCRRRSVLRSRTVGSSHSRRLSCRPNCHSSSSWVPSSSKMSHMKSMILGESRESDWGAGSARDVEASLGSGFVPAVSPVSILEGRCCCFGERMPSSLTFWRSEVGCFGLMLSYAPGGVTFSKNGGRDVISVTVRATF